MDTVTLTIDGRQVTVEKGKTVLQAAIEHGIKVPYYCYHPGLEIDGSCRVCLVKIEKMAKLQTSCSTAVAEGMVVSTATPDSVASPPAGSNRAEGMPVVKRRSGSSFCMPIIDK